MNYKVLTICIIGILIIGILTFAFSNSSNKTIKIGVIAPLSGDVGSYGQEVRSVLEIAKAEINTNNELNGQKIELFYEDSKCDSAEAAKATEKLIDVDNVKIIIGGVCSSETLAAAPITEKNKVILFSTGSSSAAVSNAGDYVFRNYPSESILGKASAELIYSKGYKNIAIISENTEYANSVVEIFTKRFNELGGKILTLQKYNTESNDFLTQLTKIKDSTSDALFIVPQSALKGGLIVKQAKELNLLIPFFGTAQFNGQDALDAGKESLNGLEYVDTPILNQNNNLVKLFLQKYTPKISDYFSGATYDSLYLLTDAIKQCDENTDCIKDYLYTVKYSGVIGNYYFDNLGDVQGIKFTDKKIINALTKQIEIEN